jgi:hypothetical protein
VLMLIYIKPSGAEPANLIPASGDQDHTISPHA